MKVDECGFVKMYMFDYEVVVIFGPSKKVDGLDDGQVEKEVVSSHFLLFFPL